MKTLKNLWIFLVIPLTAFMLTACDAETESEAEADYDAFVVWVDSTTNALEQGTEEEWNEARTRFNEWTADLERETAEWDEEARQEYQAAKTRWDEAEARAEQRWEAEANEAEVNEWSNNLLGTTDYSTINAQNIMDKYKSFMEKVRAQNDNWTEAEWENADMVMERLDERQDALDEELTTSQEAQIMAWKTEYRAMSVGEEIKGALDDDPNN